MLRCSEVIWDTVDRVVQKQILPLPLVTLIPPAVWKSRRVVCPALAAVATLFVLFVYVARSAPAVEVVTEEELPPPPAEPQEPRVVFVEAASVRACRELDDGRSCGKTHEASEGVCIFRPVNGPMYYRHPMIARQSEPLSVTEMHERCLQPRVVRRYKKITVVYKTWDDATESIRLEGKDALCLQRLIDEFNHYIAFGPGHCPWPM